MLSTWRQVIIFPSALRMVPSGLWKSPYASSRYLRPQRVFGYLHLWFNMAVTAGRADKFWLTNECSPRCILGDAAVHALCSISSISCGWCRDLHAEIRFRFHFGGVPRSTGRPASDRLPASVQQAHIFHAGIKHNFATCAAAYMSRPYRMTVVSWRMP